MEESIAATFDHGSSFNVKLKETLLGLLGANNDRKSEIEKLREDHDSLRKEFDDFVESAERENDLRKNEHRALEDKQAKENAARVADLAKLNDKLDKENEARKKEISDLDNWAKDANSAREKDIEELRKFAETENEGRKDDIEKLRTFASGENDKRIEDIKDINDRLNKEAQQRDQEDKNLHARIDKEIGDREQAVSDLASKLAAQKSDHERELAALKTRMERENAFLKALADKTNGVYFDAVRTKAYDMGGEENLKFDKCLCNAGNGLDVAEGVFRAPVGGTYLFVLHVATHDNKKALLSIRVNGVEVASVFDQNHKDNHKNSMAGTTVVVDVGRDDEVVVYAYTGTWLADFPMNHYTHFVGLLLKPNQAEIDEVRKKANADHPDKADVKAVENNADAKEEKEAGVSNGHDASQTPNGNL